MRGSLVISSSSQCTAETKKNENKDHTDPHVTHTDQNGCEVHEGQRRGGGEEGCNEWGWGRRGRMRSRWIRDKASTKQLLCQR